MKNKESEIEIGGINHITFAVSDLDKSMDFYRILFGVDIVAKSKRLAYFDVFGTWFALNIESEIDGADRQRTYTHVAFSMNEENQEKLKSKLDNHGIKYEKGRERNLKEGASIYVRDYDGHLIEFHSRNLADRLDYYRKDREDVEVLLKAYGGVFMNVLLETERLIIRDPIIEDFDSIWSMRNDSEVTAFTGGITKLSKEDLFDRHVKRCNDFEKRPKEYSVILKESGEYIGYCGFQYCEILKGTEILYGYDKKYWGKGYAGEAAKAVLEFGINTLEMKEIVAAVNPKNVASEKVLVQIGMECISEIEWPDQGMVKKYAYSKKAGN